MINRLSFLIVLLISFSIPLAQAQDISVDEKMGAKYAEQVEASMGVYENKQMTEYVTKIGERLIAQLDTVLFDYKIKLVTTTVPNAFALPGGYLYVTTGLIPIIESEDELACIMAHEIIHANNRHAVKSMKKNILPAILQIPGNILGIFSESAGAALNAPISAISTVGQASYSRKQETEADTQGIELAAKAGYNPDALKDVLSRLAKQMEITSGKAEQKSFLSDHPYTPDRVKHIDEIIANLNHEEGKAVSNNFLLVFDGIIAGNDPANGVIVGQKFIQPTANFSITMPDEWKLQQQGKVIAGLQKDDDAGFYCKYDTSSQSPEEAATAFLKKLSPSHQKLILGTQSISINNKPGYMISFSETQKGKEVYGFRIWMKMDDMMYQIYALGYAPFRETLEQIVYTIAPITDEDKKEVKIPRLKVVKAQEGETIDTLSKRSNNTLSAELSALINDHDPKTPFNKGEEVKVVVEAPYYD